MTEADEAALGSYLERALDATVQRTAVLHDGLNLNVAVETDDGRYVARRPNKLRETALFNGVAAEYRVLELLDDTAVPVPSPVLLCEDPSVLDRPFLVTTYVEGAAVPLGTDLPDRFRTRAGRRAVAHRLVDTLAAVHAVDPGQFEQVCEHKTAREQVEDALGRLDAVAAATDLSLDALEAVGERLLAAAPEHGTTRLVHGDLRPGNVLFAVADEPRVSGVLDWETAMLGDPLTELGYLLLRWRDDGDPTPSVEDLAARYPDSDALADLRETNERGLCPFSTQEGSPSRGDLVARYEDATGTTVAEGGFYVAHAAFMLATVWADLHRFAVEADRPSDREPYVDYMTVMADLAIDGALAV